MFVSKSSFQQQSCRAHQIDELCHQDQSSLSSTAGVGFSFDHWGDDHWPNLTSKKVQMGPKGVPNGQKHLGFPFGPIWTTWSVEKPAMFGVDIKLCHWVPKVPYVMRRIDFTIVYFYLKYEK